MKSNTTAQRIVAAAKALIETRGYNGFSFHDISREVGISTPSVHHHFRTKSDLGRAVLEQERSSMNNSLRMIESRADAPLGKIKRYVELWSDTAGDGGRISLLSMLAAEYNTLPEMMCAELRQIFDDNESWLTRQLRQGRTDQTLRFDGPPVIAARGLVAGLQGAIMSARPYHDAERLQSTLQWLLGNLTAQKRDRTSSSV